MSALHVLAILIPLSTIIPIYHIVRRTGYNGWLCVLALVPVINLVFVWAFAFLPWPAVDRR